MTKELLLKGDLRECLNEAEAFYTVGKHYAVAEELILPSPFVYPVIVNLAFSCELYFKALMIWRSQENNFWKGHSLVYLFSKLAASDQKEIRELYTPDFPNWSFDDAIKEFDTTFEDWRYAFQEGKDDLVSTIFEHITFADAVREYSTYLIR